VKKKLKMQVVKAPCACGAAHATWWKTTPPPGCKRAAEEA